MRQMLRDWPVEKLSWWSCLPENDNRFGQRVSAHRVARIPSRLYPNTRLRWQKSWLLEHIWTSWAARHFRQTLAELRPEAVWVIPHAWAIPPLANQLPNCRTGFHVSIHDYMDSRAYKARFGRGRSRRLVEMTERLYSEATTRDAICEPMALDLQAQTGKKADLIVRAGLVKEDLERVQGEQKEPAADIRIAYAGTILVEDAFEIFVNVVSAIRERLPAPVRLELYGSHSYRDRKWFDARWMREGGNLTEQELSEALRGCTWGFLPMGLDDNDPRYNRFSLPTKFSSYLAAGLPVITLGHPESSVVKIARAYDVGVCLTAQGFDDLCAQLLAALAEPAPRQRFAREIQRCAIAEFDAVRMRRMLYECFQKCATETRNRPGFG